MLPSERYQRQADDIRGFLDRYREVIAAADRIAPTNTWVTGSRLDSFQGSDLELVDAAALAAGRATPIANELQLISIFDQVVNPIADWRNSLRRNHPLTPALIDSYCTQLIGRLEQQAETARMRETGLVGLFARFVRIPYDVREAAGIDLSANAQRGAFLVGVAIQVVSGLLVAGVLAAIAVLIAHL